MIICWASCWTDPPESADRTSVHHQSPASRRGCISHHLHRFPAAVLSIHFRQFAHQQIIVGHLTIRFDGVCCATLIKPLNTTRPLSLTIVLCNCRLLPKKKPLLCSSQVRVSHTSFFAGIARLLIRNMPSLAIEFYVLVLCRNTAPPSRKLSLMRWHRQPATDRYGQSGD